MVIAYGTGFYGKVATLNNQWIETKFFHVLYVPIFPISSILVTSSGWRTRSGINIANHKKSIIATYARTVTLLIAAWTLYITFWGHSYYVTPQDARNAFIMHLVIALIFASAAIYFFFFYSKATADEITARNKMGSITNIYGLPHWFEYPYLMDKLRGFLLEYKNKYPDRDWKADLRAGHVEKEKRPLLYAIALFNCMVYDLPENDELYAKADGIYDPEPQVKPA